MPKLLIFAPCERVILSDENTVSLITLFQSLQFAVAKSEKLPDKAALPMRWYVFAMWQAFPEELGEKEFEQKVELILPDGSIGMSEQVKFRFAAGKPFHRVTNVFMNFPVYQSGNCSIRLSLKDSSNDWQEKASFPLELKRSSPEEFQTQRSS